MEEKKDFSYYASFRRLGVGIFFGINFETPCVRKQILSLDILLVAAFLNS